MSSALPHTRGSNIPRRDASAVVVRHTWSTFWIWSFGVPWIGLSSSFGMGLKDLAAYLSGSHRASFRSAVLNSRLLLVKVLRTLADGHSSSDDHCSAFPRPLHDPGASERLTMRRCHSSSRLSPSPWKTSAHVSYELAPSPFV